MIQDRSSRWNGRALRLPVRKWPPVGSLIRTSPTGLVVLAIITGAGAGLGAIAFRYLILWFTLAFSGHADYSGAGNAPNPLVPWLGMWFVVLAPVVAGLLYGPLIHHFAREARGHGVPEVMLAVAERGGRIRPQVAVVKSLASALCIGGGGSVGREGPIVQIGSALGSTIGQVLRLSESRLKLLLACGAAGGVSATFNAPIAGVLFALELILRDFEAESFGVVVLASVTASVIGRAAFGSAAFLSLPCSGSRPSGSTVCTRGSGFSPRSSAWPSSGCCMASRMWRIDGGAVPSGCGLRPVGSCSGSCCWSFPRCTASATRSSNGPFASSMFLSSCCCSWSARSSRRLDDCDRRLGGRVRAIVVHRRDAGDGVR